MRYLLVLLGSALLACPALLACAFALAPAPIAAEYWVRQALVIKRDIARHHLGSRKVLVVGGSSALFGIDTAALSRDLGRPAINLGLHAGIPLGVMLSEAVATAQPGDLVILALEPDGYCAGPVNDWYLRNALAWRPEAWRELSLGDRSLGFWRAGPWFLAELAMARAARLVLPGAIQDRLDALDDAATLRRRANAPEPDGFAYSAFHLDELGNMRKTEGTRRLRIEPIPEDAAVPVCAYPREVLRRFVERQRERSIAVRIAHFPFVSVAGMSPERVDAAEREFLRGLADVATVVDTRAEATYERSLFFDTGLHLNAEGRRLRTEALARALRRDATLAPSIAAGAPGR